MTIATLKKKTNATYKNHTVNNNQRIVLFSRAAGDSKQNVFTGPTAAFTLNGKVRSTSYIGKNYHMSNSPGNGSSYCCSDSSNTVKPVGFTAREVMRKRKLWKKRPFTRNEIPAEYDMPSRGQLQHVCNNWVKNTETSDSGSQSMYLENKVTKNILCSMKSNTIVTSKKCTDNANCVNSRIGGKLLPLSNTLPVTKNILKGNPYSSGMYMRINTALKVNQSNFGFNKHFPFPRPISSYENCGVQHLQANDPELLKTYYKDGNTNPTNCK